MTSALRLGLVGCGRLAERGYLPALVGVPGFEVVAVADPDPSRAAGLAPEAAHFASAEALLTGTWVHAVVIASPVAAHVDDARAAAAAGLPALLEKPPALDGPSAAALLDLLPAPFIGFNRRFDPGAAAARAACARLGPDEPVDLDLGLQYRRPGWGALTVADDAWLDLGPHLVDWARWISGREVEAVTTAELTHDRATVVLELTGGASARCTAATDRPHEEQLTVRNGSQVLAEQRVGGVVAGLRSRILPRRTPDLLVQTLRAELLAYERAIRSGDAGSLGRVRDGWATMAVIDAARTSSAEGGRTVAVPHEVP